MSGRYAVMGHPVRHSLSPVIHQLFARQMGFFLEYEKINVELSRFEEHVNRFFDDGGEGLNITLPYKSHAFHLAAHQSPRAVHAQVANTLWRDADGLHADNTDGVGLIRDLARYIDLVDKHILLLGAGGAARAILPCLIVNRPASLLIANRTFQRAHALACDFLPASSCDLSELAGSFDLIINATSLSLSNQIPDLSSVSVKPSTVFYDLSYQQTRTTTFVVWARQRGYEAVDGLGMLVEQAAESFAIWHGVLPDTAPVLDYIRHGLNDDCS